MVGRHMETYRKSKEQRSQKDVFPVGKGHRGQYPGHVGDGDHFGDMARLYDLHVIGTKSYRHTSQNGYPGIDPQGKEQKESSQKRKKKV